MTIFESFLKISQAQQSLVTELPETRGRICYSEVALTLEYTGESEADVMAQIALDLLDFQEDPDVEDEVTSTIVTKNLDLTEGDVRATVVFLFSPLVATSESVYAHSDELDLTVEDVAQWLVRHIEDAEAVVAREAEVYTADPEFERLLAEEEELERSAAPVTDFADPHAGYDWDDCPACKTGEFRTTRDVWLD